MLTLQRRTPIIALQQAAGVTRSLQRISLWVTSYIAVAVNSELRELLQCCYQHAALVSGQGAQSPGHLVAILVIRPTARGARLLLVAAGFVVDGRWLGAQMVLLLLAMVYWMEWRCRYH